MLRKNLNIQKMIDNSIIAYDDTWKAIDLLYVLPITETSFPGNNPNSLFEEIYNNTVIFNKPVYDYDFLYIIWSDSIIDGLIYNKPGINLNWSLDTTTPPMIVPLASRPKILLYVAHYDATAPDKDTPHYGAGTLINSRIELENNTTTNVKIIMYRCYSFTINTYFDRSNGLVIYGLKKNFKTFYQNMVKLYKNIIYNIRNLYISPLSLI